MLGKSKEESGISKPNPDPTVYTNDAIERASESQRDYIDGSIRVLTERMNGMDERQQIRYVNVKELLAQAETLRVEQKNDATTGLAAALSAQKELAAAENTSNKLAIAKSEQGTTDTIKTNQEANNERFAQVIKSLDEVKLAVSRLETSKQAVVDDRSEHRSQGNYTMAIISSIIGIILFITGILGTYALAKDRNPTNTPVITVETPTK